MRCLKQAYGRFARSTTGIFPKGSKIEEDGRIAILRPTSLGFWRWHVERRPNFDSAAKVWTFTYYGYGVGVFPPGKSDFNQFLKAAHTVNLAQGEAFRSIKASSHAGALACPSRRLSSGALVRYGRSRQRQRAGSHTRPAAPSQAGRSVMDDSPAGVHRSDPIG